MKVTLKVAMEGPDVSLKVGDQMEVHEAQYKRLLDADMIEPEPIKVEPITKPQKEVKPKKSKTKKKAVK